MSEQALSVPSIKVNNDSIGIVPNTFKYKTGDGEIKVRAASSGGGHAVSVHSVDAESMFSIIKFSVYPTADMIKKIRAWKLNVGTNTLEALQRMKDKDFSISFVGISVTNDPEISAAADGVIEIEMAGDMVS